MKTLSVIGSMIMATLFFTACHVEDLATPVNAQEESLTTRRAPQGVPTYGGYATALNATIRTTQNGTVVSNQYLFANTGLLPVAGGMLEANESQAVIEGVVSSSSLSAHTSGQNSLTVSEATVTNLNITINGYVITADYVATTATTSCTTATGSTQIENLVVNGTTVTVTGALNQTVVLSPSSFLIINEQSTSKKVGGKNKTVSGLHFVGGGSDIRVATVQAVIKC